jgi:hypothetical protein
MDSNSLRTGVFIFLIKLANLHCYFVGKGLNLLFHRIDPSPKAVVSVLLKKGDGS